MKVAVTNHAVDRYLERVDGARGFHRESVRDQIRRIVEEGFDLGFVRDHPLDSDRRVIPFRSGDTLLFLSIGPNTTSYEADLAVIGVLYEKELSYGKVGMGLRLGDLFPELQDRPLQEKKPQYLLLVGPVESTIERYFVASESDLREIVNTRKPKVEEVTIYQLIE
jgi:hypothetical protein